eukprot:TCONS_00040123-protein
MHHGESFGENSLSRYRLFDKDFVVYVGLLSQPESEVMNIHYDGRVSFCRRLPYVQVLNTYKGENDGSQYREITQWYPRTNDCTVIGLKEFIEKETGIPVENQMLYHDAEYISDGRSILKILLRNDKDCPVVIHLMCKINQSQSNEFISPKAKELGIQAISSITVEDAKHHLTLFEDFISKLAHNENWLTKLRLCISLPSHLYHLESTSGFMVISE